MRLWGDDSMYTWRDEPTVYRHLDFSDCGTLGEVHEQIRKELELPRWYGQNPDALWDSLTGIMAIPEDVTTVYKPRRSCGRIFWRLSRYFRRRRIRQGC